MERVKLLAMLSISAAVLAGCRTQPPLEPDVRSGIVGANAIETEGAQQYSPEEADSYYDYPIAAPSNALPVYPEGMLAARLPPVRIKVRLIVDEQGVVSQCSPIDPSDAVHPEFVAAIQDAVRGWRFMPLVSIKRGTEQTSVAAHGHRTIYPGRATALPFHEDYEFTFTQRDGKGDASMSGSDGPAQPK
jgi:hypothetical protein